MTNKTRLTLIALAIAFGLAGCATPPGTADATLLHQVDTVMRQASPARSVKLSLSAEQIKTGESISAQVSTDAAGYVYLYQIETDGRGLSLVFPNAMDGANYAAAGTALTLPRPNWRMAARGPAGVGHMLAVVTQAPLDLVALQADTRQGKVVVSPPYGAAMVTLREVAP